uniref:Uncharacterized protein n=1 Tax=Vespula pensylvanica TaxID=30213 RepID=A0A834KUW9_VESPE|nr:hypothetical protein H0235_013248 [Vespula pensylvanica]
MRLKIREKSFPESPDFYYLLLAPFVRTKQKNILRRLTSSKDYCELVDFKRSFYRSELFDKFIKRHETIFPSVFEGKRILKLVRNYLLVQKLKTCHIYNTEEENTDNGENLSGSALRKEKHAGLVVYINGLDSTEVERISPGIAVCVAHRVRNKALASDMYSNATEEGMKSRRKGEKDKDDGGRAKGAAQLRGDQDTEEVCGTRGYSAFCLSFIREALHGNAAAELPTTANFSTMLVTLCCIRKHPTPEILVFSVVAATSSRSYVQPKQEKEKEDEDERRRSCERINKSLEDESITNRRLFAPSEEYDDGGKNDTIAISRGREYRSHVSRSTEEWWKVHHLTQKKILAKGGEFILDFRKLISALLQELQARPQAAAWILGAAYTTANITSTRSKRTNSITQTISLRWNQPIESLLLFRTKVYRVCKRLNRHWQQEASGHPTKVLPKSPIPNQRRGGKASSVPGGGPGRRNEEHSTLLYEVLRLRRRKVGWEHSSGFVDPRTGKQGVAGRSVEVVGSSSADDGGNDVGSHGSWSNCGKKGEPVSRQRWTLTRSVLKVAYCSTQSVLLLAKVAKYDRRNRETTLSAEASADGSKREG